MAVPAPMLSQPFPTGTVTFLFTDIEGSTRLWQEQPERMPTALLRHDALLQAAIAEVGGYVFKKMGDAFCAAFATATGALAAALTAQCSLLAEPWGEGMPMRVRMAVHTGAAEARDGDYFGVTLSRVARLLSAGHGGQTLLSQSAYDLCRDHPPPAASFADLGSHRLKDLARPEQVYQLCHPDLPDDFPPLRTLDNLPNNLPQQVTSFIGREKEIETLKRLLGGARLLTVTGSGGVGKTRLALHVVADDLERYPDGAWLVELAPITDPALVLQTVASVVGVREQSGKTVLQTLQDFLKTRHLLLVLDNCEHLIEACAQLADALIRSCAQVTILATSREALGIAGETPWRLPSLSMPSPREVVSAERLAEYEALRLFVERANIVNPGFSLRTVSAVTALTEICRRLDGIPLAIELAAARMRVLTVEQIANKLEDRFRLLTGGSRTALPRQQTLRALIDWSYSLLTVAEQTLLRRVSVFAGGWSLEAAEAVCEGDDVEDWQVLDLLTSLADKSLVLVEEQKENVRYGLLETVRQYSRERLFEGAEGHRVRSRHAAYFSRYAQDGTPFQRQENPQARSDSLEIEHDNLRVALEWLLSKWSPTQSSDELAENDDPSIRVPHLKGVLELLNVLNGFWVQRGRFTEAVFWYHRFNEEISNAMATNQDMDADLRWARARAVYGEGQLQFQQGNLVSAASLLQSAVSLFETIGDTKFTCIALHNRGLTALLEGDYTLARACFEEEAEREGQMSPTICMDLGRVAQAQGHPEEARLLLEQSRSAFALKSAGSFERRMLSLSLGYLGNIALRQGDLAAARQHWHESMALRRLRGETRLIVFALEGMASLAAAHGNWVRAARLWGAAAARREQIQVVLTPHERRDYEADVAAASMSDPDAFTAEWRNGTLLSLPEAMDYALQEEEC